MSRTTQLVNNIRRDSRELLLNDLTTEEAQEQLTNLGADVIVAALMGIVTEQKFFRNAPKKAIDKPKKKIGRPKKAAPQVENILNHKVDIILDNFLGSNGVKPQTIGATKRAFKSNNLATVKDVFNRCTDKHGVDMSKLLTDTKWFTKTTVDTWQNAFMKSYGKPFIEAF